MRLVRYESYLLLAGSGRIRTKYKSDCGSQCKPGTQKLTTTRCDYTTSQGATEKNLCCPFGATPDPNFCTWRAGGIDGVCNGACESGELVVAQDSWAVIDGQPAHCFTGKADYCCKAVESGAGVCGWVNTCVNIDKNGQPVQSNVCPTGRKFVTYARAGPPGWCDAGKNTWLPFCCDEQVNTQSCHWVGSGGGPHFCDDAKSCKGGEINLGSEPEGGGEDCEFQSAGSSIGSGFPVLVERSLCCSANDLSFTTNTLPVPLNYLFPKPGPSSDKQKWNIELDSTMGGQEAPNPSSDENDNSFGWHIMSGPSDEITSLVKRDGSHWEVYGCDTEKHEGRQTAKMVCTDESEDSNCNVIRSGRGVAETVVEMPSRCGPGKYAMAVSLEPSESQDMPTHLRKRGLKNPVVYDFTFDYDFTPLQRRADSKVLLRIDYSDDPGYWNNIVGEYPLSP
jgi:chitinase